MKSLYLLAILCGTSWGQSFGPVGNVAPIPSMLSVTSLTVTGTSTFLSTVTIVTTDGNYGLTVTNGIYAASATIAGALTASSGTFTATGSGYGLLVTNGVKAASATFTGALTASSGTFTQSGANVYSLALSSGINMPSGTVNAGMLLGDGSRLTNLPIPGTPNTFASSVTIVGNLGVQGAVNAPLTTTSSVTVNGNLGLNGAINAPLTTTSSVTINQNLGVSNTLSVGTNVVNGFGAVFFSSGTAAIVSTSPTSGSPVFTVYNSTGMPIIQVFQGSTAGTASTVKGYNTANGTSQWTLSEAGNFTGNLGTFGGLLTANSNITDNGSLSLIGNKGLLDQSSMSVAGSATFFSSVSVNTSGNVFGTTPAAVFSPNLSSNTVTTSLSGTFSTTTLGSCYSGSTVSLNFPANIGSALVLLNLTESNSSLNASLIAGFLVDGLFVNGQSSTKGIVSPQETVATDGTNMSFAVMTTALTSGIHSFCLTLSASAGTSTIDSTGSAATFRVVMMP